MYWPVAYFTTIASLSQMRLSVSSMFGVILVFRLVFAIKLLKKQQENMIIPSVRFCKLKYRLCCDASNHASRRVHVANEDEH